MLSSIIGIAFDCPNANDLADFYVKLFGWKKEISSDEWAGIRTPEGILLVFQTIENYIPPVWPWKDGKQQQMAHIDFKVDDLREAEEHALQCGAVKADTQYYDTSTVMFDPAGHPFCLSTILQSRCSAFLLILLQLAFCLLNFTIWFKYAVTSIRKVKNKENI